MQLKTIPIDQISEGSRSRQDYGDLSKLTNSILTNGLIQPIAVGLYENYKPAKSSETEEDFTFSYLLLAGGRRFRACTLAGFTSIPVRIYERMLTKLELRSIELEENIQRKELTWKETLALEKEIHELQVAIHGPKISTTPNASGHSMRDTAKLLNKSHATISLNLKLSKAIESQPELPWDKCKNKSAANRLLKETKTKPIPETKKPPKPKTQKLIDSFILRDCLEAMEEFPPETFHLAELNISIRAKLPKFCSELFHIMAKDSWVIFWDKTLTEYLEASGFSIVVPAGIWLVKSKTIDGPGLSHNYQNFYYAKKGNPKLNKPNRSNVFNSSYVVEFFREVFRTFTKPNSRVLIPFAGSGKALIAAAYEEMIPIGYSMSKDLKDSYTFEINKTFGEAE